jgi:hypothetical protein
VFSIEIDHDFKLSKQNIIRNENYHELANIHASEVLSVRQFDIKKSRKLYDDENINYCVNYIYHFSRLTFLAKLKKILSFTIVLFFILSMFYAAYSLYNKFGFGLMFSLLSLTASCCFIKFVLMYKKRNKYKALKKVKLELLSFIEKT